MRRAVHQPCLLYTSYYDLNENLLFEYNDGESPLVCYYTGVENLFFRYYFQEDERFTYLQLFEMSGENVVNVATGNDTIEGMINGEGLATVSYTHLHPSSGAYGQ